MAKDVIKNPIDPIYQFEITNYYTFGEIGGDGGAGTGIEFAFTNSALFMVLTVGLIASFLILSTRGRGLVPGRMQLLSEITYEFVANMVRTNAGTEGMKFFPFVFSLFMFILVANMFGMFPYFFTVTSQIVITAALALLVFGVVVVYGFYRNGLKFLGLFVPKGIHWVILLLVTPIEIISFLSRPLSLSLRLFGNMLAGHIVIKVFGGMTVALLSAGFWAPVAILPFVMIIAMTGLEFLVSALQAFVFAVLTCIYINDAIHPSH
ncbi:MAG: F0F1 ATP synthase subunit A [Alphaproteobacteria bacterium]|nr:F0F1 ATP synthase subunit A [Alphaproteobacteria bacterium]